MSIVKKLIGSGSLLAACILSLGLAVPAPCAAASADPGDLPEIFIPKPPPPAPPPAQLAASEDPGDLPEIFIPKPPPPAPPPARA